MTACCILSPHCCHQSQWWDVFIYTSLHLLCQKTRHLVKWNELARGLDLQERPTMSACQANGVHAGRIWSCCSYKGNSNDVSWHHMPVFSSKADLRGHTHTCSHMGIHFKELAGTLRRLASLMSEGKAIRLETSSSSRSVCRQSSSLFCSIAPAPAGKRPTTFRA